MKKLLMLLSICCVLLLVFGCSESPRVTEPTGQTSLGTLVQRPQFIENRPESVIQQHILATSTSLLAEKRPPKPPPDTTPTGDDPNPNPAHKYAYIVGIADYDGTVNDLQYPDDDAMDMKAYFQSQGFSIRMDLNRSATADAIVAGLQWLVASAQPGDEILFSYSGHGGKAPGYGSSIISTDLYYVTHGYVMQIFNSANCTKKLVTLDACVIGDFNSDCQIGSIVATASNKTNSYDAPDLKNGAWTYYFVEAAAGLGYPYAEDVATYAEDGMRAWASQYNLNVSPKHTDKYTGMFDM